MKYRVTLSNLVNENKHITVHKTRDEAERYRQGYIDWQRLPGALIEIDEIEDEEDDQQDSDR